MHQSSTVRLFVICLIVSSCDSLYVIPTGWAVPPEAVEEESSLYNADPDHLWNRLHEAIFVRIGPAGHVYGRDRLDPLLWRDSKHLLESDSNERVVDLLTEFLLDRNAREIREADTLKRAVLQRDLWSVFNWLVDSRQSLTQPLHGPKREQSRRELLLHNLGAVIERLALSPAQIEGLPDNYAAAVASGQFPQRFDPDRPEQSYLPPDLLAVDGSWVCVGRPDGPIAPEHLLDTGTNSFTNSYFLLFIRLPGEKSSTREYLKRLREFAQPILVNSNTREKPAKFVPNPKLPPIPVGTELALLRRAMLISTNNRPMASPLTESVQFRVYREVPELTEQTLSAALVTGTAANRQAQSWQSFHEFRLNRSALFAGQAGGLRPVGPDERDFLSGFGSHHYDVFESRNSDSTDLSAWERRRHVVTQQCSACHSLPGAYSFNSHFNYRNHLNDRDDSARALTLLEMAKSDVAAEAVKWKEGRSHWVKLRALLEKE